MICESWRIQLLRLTSGKNNVVAVHFRYQGKRLWIDCRRFSVKIHDLVLGRIAMLRT